MKSSLHDVDDWTSWAIHHFAKDPQRLKYEIENSTGLYYETILGLMQALHILQEREDAKNHTHHPQIH